MLLLLTEKLPEGSGWQYEVKLDGYRAVAIKTSGRVHLRSRNGKDFTFPDGRGSEAAVRALRALVVQRNPVRINSNLGERALHGVVGRVDLG
jgi:ATP-dependent DNA ligase